jgi:hypothetical protein
MTSATIHSLAEAHGLTTADKIRRPPGAGIEDKKERERWSAEKIALFHQLEPSAVYFAGNDGPEPRYFGDNMGSWPILLGTTASRVDNITANMDRFSPSKWRGLLFRAWTPEFAMTKRLLAFCEGMIRDRIEQGSMERMRKSWVDFGPETDLKLFEFEVHTLARKAGINTIGGDKDLSAWLDGILKRRAERQVERRR